MTTIPTNYIRTVLGPREELLEKILRDALLNHNLPPMQIDDNAARVLQLLTLICQPQQVIEVGTFFGYASIHIARGLPEGGRLTTLEINPEIAELARRNIASAHLGNCVEVVVGPAADYLAQVEPESIDMIFIDADKRSYPDYLKLCFPLLCPGGLLVADDAFSQGDFSREAGGHGDGSMEIRAINTYNLAAVRSPRLFSAFIGTNNGLLVSYKR
jgi:predicted O-methyltransferase YrrM